MSIHNKFLKIHIFIILLCAMMGCGTMELQRAIVGGDVQSFSKLVQDKPELLNGAVVSDKMLQGTSLHDLEIVGATFENVGFTNSDWIGITFKNCTFKGVDFNNSRFSNVRFMDCTLSYVENSGDDFIPTIFNDSLFDRVGFGQGSVLEHVSCEGLILGSSLSIVGCTLRAPMSEEDSTLLRDATLSNFIVEKSKAISVCLSYGVTVTGRTVFKNNSFTSVQLFGLDAQDVVISDNKDFDLVISGTIQNLTVDKNEDSEIAFDGTFANANVYNFSGKGNLFALGGKGNNVGLVDNLGLYVELGDLDVQRVAIQNGKKFESVSFGGLKCDEVALTDLDTDELTFLGAEVQNLHLTNVLVKKLSNMTRNKIGKKTVQNVKLAPSVVYYKRWKDETKAFWGDLLSNQK